MRSASPVPTMAFACSNLVISPTAMTGIYVFILTARGRHLIARTDRDVLSWNEATARDVNRSAAPRFQRLRYCNRLIDVPAAVHPVRTGDPHRNRPSGWKDGPYRLKDLERETHTLLQAPAILIVTTAGKGWEVLVQQIAVCGVELNGIDVKPSGRVGPPRQMLDECAQVLPD